MLNKTSYKVIKPLPFTKHTSQLSIEQLVAPILAVEKKY